MKEGKSIVVCCYACGSSNIKPEPKIEAKFKLVGKKRIDIRNSYISYICQNCGYKYNEL